LGRDVGGRWRPTRPWVFATYETASLGSLLELMHESGHAIHYAAVRTRPALFDWAEADTAFVEGIADVVGWNVDEPAWQVAYLGDAVRPSVALRSRYAAVMLDICWALFEIELHRAPDRRPNDVWTKLTHRYLGIAPHPELSWWAVRGQLVDSPGYMANYAASAIIAADVRARLRDLRGDWSGGDPGWFPVMSERLLRFGATRSPAEILADFLGRPLSPEALLADVRRLGVT
jgi:oligoendopeptidase F